MSALLIPVRYITSMQTSPTLINDVVYEKKTTTFFFTFKLLQPATVWMKLKLLTKQNHFFFLFGLSN